MYGGSGASRGYGPNDGEYGGNGNNGGHGGGNGAMNDGYGGGNGGNEGGNGGGGTWRQQQESAAIQAGKIAEQKAVEAALVAKTADAMVVEKLPTTRKITPSKKKDKELIKETRRYRKKSKKMESSSEDASSTSEEDATSDTSSDSDIDERRHAKSTKRALKLAQKRKGKKQARGSKKKDESPVGNQVQHARGECSKDNRAGVRGKSPELHWVEEPVTPVATKHMLAECSQKGMIEYCLSAHKLYAGEKASALRKICVREGIRYTKKPLIIEELAKRQVMLAYDGFDEDVVRRPAMMDEDRRDAAKTPKLTTPIAGRVTPRPRSERVALRSAHGAPDLKWMRRLGPERFVVVPLLHISREEDLAFEKHLIRDLSPSLNTCGMQMQGGGERGHRRRRKGKRQRAGTARRVNTYNQNTVSFEDGGSTHLSLLSCLQQAWVGKLKKKVLTFRKGGAWVDDLRGIKRQFGMTEVLSGQYKKLLRHAKGELQRGGDFVFIRICRTTTTAERNKQELRRILKSPKMACGLVNHTVNKLIGMYKAAGVSIRKRITVKLPYDPRIMRREVRRVAEVLINDSIKDRALASVVKGRIRIVWTKNRTVAEITHNHKKASNIQPVVCTCARFDLTRKDGHVLTRFAEMRDVPTFMRNGWNITFHEGNSEPGYIAQRIWEAGKHLGPVGRPSVDSGRVFKGKAVAIRAWSDQEVRAWAEKLQGLILAPVDRNNGDTAVMCPMLYRHCFGATFVWNSNYEKMQVEEAEVLRAYKKEFVDEGLDKIGDWKRDGRIGSAFVLPKDKDLGKWRPIAPSFADPAVLVQKRVAKALHHMLVTFPERSSMCLNSVADLKARIGGMNFRLGKERPVGVADRALVCGVRIMDDVSVIVGFRDHDEDEHRAIKILDEFEGIYDNHLQLVRKDDHRNMWHFIGGDIYITKAPAQVYFVPKTKNTDCLRETGKLHFQTLQDFSSFSEKSTKKAVISAGLRRLWEQSTSRALVIGPIAYATWEAHLRGYPPEVSLGALAKLARAADDRMLEALWKAFASIQGIVPKRYVG
ncbi:hypothetical protein CBR_g53690 [Chara braunii]|uniref:Uncharacterized protein n=1 Tax=Chara braunii TaxID=69332 RepID=A0A388MB44_CHABU|nr:hypothetical protein CBR_g53690 [Chara braunii]|eukprot:GBG91801.1 hypothetical protein CBR_g53690 [Chara braunii]